MKSVNLQDLLKDGFTKKFAMYYLSIRENELKNSIYDKEFVEWSYANGFTAESASLMGVTDDNKEFFLSDYDYYKSWPVNDWSRIWINDKLTLKYSLSNHKFYKFMPKYYYYASVSGLKTLMDNESGNSYEDFLLTLKKVGVFACKPCNGAQSAGFYKLSCCNNNYFINNLTVSKNEIVEFVKSHLNYVYTEYIVPCAKFKKYGDIIHTLRVIVLNTNGDNPEIIGNYLRLPSNDNDVANYTAHDGNNNEKYNVWVHINFETGEYGDGIITYPNKTLKVENHPNTGAPLCGILDNFREIKEAALEISKWFSNLDLLGFDFGITTEGLKIMEINSHPGITIPQIYDPFFKNETVKSYFNDKLASINSLSNEAKSKRNSICR